jgi:hypothetical protein
MNSHVDVVPVETVALDKAPSKHRISMIFYLTAIAVAMLGWLAAFGWAAIALANWLSR